MIAGSVQLSSADIERLAALHATCLPDSVLVAVGGDLLARYYQWVIRSPLEQPGKLPSG